MENCYQQTTSSTSTSSVDYYSTSPSSSSMSPYSMTGGVQQQFQGAPIQQHYVPPQYSMPVSTSHYEQNGYQDYCQQYGMYYPMNYQQQMLPIQQPVIAQSVENDQIPTTTTPAPTDNTIVDQIYDHVDSMYHRKPRRGAYSAFQLQHLTQRFKKSTTIPIAERKEMSKLIGLTPEQIKVWFQNKRYKLKKMGGPVREQSPERNGYKPY